MDGVLDAIRYLRRRVPHLYFFCSSCAQSERFPLGQEFRLRIPRLVKVSHQPSTFTKSTGVNRSALKPSVVKCMHTKSVANNRHADCSHLLCANTRSWSSVRFAFMREYTVIIDVGTVDSWLCVTEKARSLFRLRSFSLQRH